MSNFNKEVVEIDKAEFVECPASPSKKKSAVQDRLENSPKRVSTPEQQRRRQELADKRRQELEDEKKKKAHDDVEKAKEKARRAKENPPLPTTEPIP